MLMFLKKTPNSKGRINLAIVDGYYDKDTKKTKHKVIESLGYLDEIEKQYSDPIAYFSNRAKQLTMILLKFKTIVNDLDIPEFGNHDSYNDAIMTAMIFLKLKNLAKQKKINF